MTEQSEAKKGVDYLYYYAGLRFIKKGEFSMVFEAVDPEASPQSSLSFSVDLKRSNGAQIGQAYKLEKLPDGNSWAFAKGGKWYQFRDENFFASEADVAVWQTQDRAAKDNDKATKFSNDDAMKASMTKLFMIYDRLSIAEQPSFEVWVIRQLRSMKR